TPLSTKAAPPRERDRAGVVWLNVRFQPVQTQPAECVTNNKSKPLGHITLPGAGCICVVTKISHLCRTTDDLVGIDHTDDGIVLPAAHHKTHVTVGLVSREPAPPGGHRQRRIYPAPMKLPALTRELQQRPRIRVGRRTNECSRSFHVKSIEPVAQAR